jgi:hypothetical protein
MQTDEQESQKRKTKLIGLIVHFLLLYVLKSFFKLGTKHIYNRVRLCALISYNHIRIITKHFDVQT